VVSPSTNSVVYHSTPDFAPRPDVAVDATTDLFQVRMQDFGSIVSEIRRFTSTFTAGPLQGTGTSTTVSEHIVLPPDAGRALKMREGGPVSIFVQQSAPQSSVTGASAARLATTTTTARWRLLVKHPSGSLEAAVNAARRLNLIISSSILSVLGASVALLVLSTRRAQELARQQMEFVAAVSHELRTPLTFIKGATELLQSEGIDSAVRDDLQGRLQQSFNRLEAVIDSIVDVGRLTRRVVAPNRKKVDVYTIVVEVADEMTRRDHTISVEYGSALASVDPAQVERIVESLFANAIRHTPPGTKISAAVTRTPEGVLIVVDDSGPGIAAGEHQGKDDADAD